MYQPYWGLDESPFRGQFDPRYFHKGLPQDEALARLQFLVAEQRTLGLLLGEAGCGKSLLVEMFARELSPLAHQTAAVNLVGLDARSFLWQLACGLGVDAAASASPFQLYQAISDHIQATHYQQLLTVLLLDDADEAQSEVKDCIVRLAQTATIRGAALTVVVSAQPTRLVRLGRRLLEMSELRIDLEPWEQDDTITFVKAALTAAGRATPLFSDSALVRLHELAGGIPRRVKQLADLALLVGAGASLGQVEADTVESAYRELCIVVPESPELTLAHS